MNVLPDTFTARSLMRLVFRLSVRSSVPEHSTSWNGSAFSYRLCEAMLCGVQRSVRIGRLEHEMIAAQPREHAVRRLAVDHRRRAAFEDLRRMPGDAWRESRASSGIAAKIAVSLARPARITSAPGLERAHERLGAHHADDVLAAVDHGLVESRRRMRAA